MNNGGNGVGFKLQVGSEEASQGLDKLVSVLETLISSIKSLEEAITTASGGITKMAEEAEKSFQKTNVEIDETSETLKNLNQTLKNVNFQAIFNNFSNMTRIIRKYTDYFVDYIEDLNLLKVAFGDTAEEARDLVDAMADITGFDEKTLTRGLATFRQLASTLNLTNKDADLLATNLQKLALDISSLYNVSLDRASYSLTGALTGQPRSIKSLTGADVTQDTLNTDLANLGINKTAKELNQAEQAIVTYISLIRQLNNANGDLARTIDQPANMLKIFNEQVKEAGRSLGNLFIPVIQTVIPWLTAFLMVFNEVVGVITSLLGIDTDSFWEGISSGNASENLEQIQKNLNGIGASAKSAKSGLRGFDKLNVIKTPSSSGAGVGNMGISPEILALLEEYDLQLEKVSTKATEIRDKIMEWLGFSKDLNGEWKFTDVTFGTIIGSLVGIVTLSNLVLAPFKILSKLGLGKTFSDLGTSIASIAKITTGLSSSFLAVTTFVAGLAIAIYGVYEIINGIDEILKGDTLSGVFSIIQGIALLVAGVALLFGGWTVALIAGLVAITAYVVEWCVENWNIISGFFKDLWKGFLNIFWYPIKDVVVGIATWVWDKVIEPIIEFFAPIVEAITSLIGHALSTAWEIVSGVGKAIWSIITKVWEIFWKIVEIFVALGTAFYTYAIKPMLEWIGKIATWVWEKVLEPVLGFFKKVGIWFYDHIIAPIWNKIVWLKDKAVGIFKTIGTFVIDFIGGGIKAVINGVLSAIENTINFFIKAINKAIGVINAIPGVEIKKLTELNIPKLADGGFVDTGQLFVAREAGPEIVGNIGNKTAVANNDQIVDAVAQGVTNAIIASGAFNGSKVVIEAHGDADGMMNFITFKQKEKDMQFGN